MNNFSYFELISFFYRSIFALVKQGESMKLARARALDSFWDHSPSSSELQNIIVLIESLNVEYSDSKTFRPQVIELYMSLLNRVNDIDLNNHLNKYEIEVFKESIELLNDQINKNK